jgi:hypothetical protein
LIHCDPQEKPQEVSVAIALHPRVLIDLKNLNETFFSSWNHQQVQSFSVATEEISHFRYFVFHANQKREVSQLELEFQGEIDKFLLLYLLSQQYEQSFQTLFEHFSFPSTLTKEESERYETAHQLAKEFIQKRKHFFTSSLEFSNLLKELRAHYRMSPEERFSLIHRI